MGETKKKGCLAGCLRWAAIVVAAVLVAGWLARPRSGTVPSRPAARSLPSLAVGQRVLVAKPGQRAFLAVDAEGAWEALIDAENTLDIHNVAVLIEAGRAFGVPGGTEGVVVRKGVLSALVRVADGREGWIQLEELSPAP